jgi:dTDP-4-dehydrorhamnose reductase
MADTTASAPDLLVIGGSGLLGRALVGLAAHRGVDVHATGFREPAGPTGRWHRLDMSDGGHDAARLIGRLRPATVVNAAYVQSGDDLDAVTARAPGEIAAACAEAGHRFVHLSSDVVFDGQKPSAYVEADLPSPVHAYGNAKARAEELVATADPDASIIRTSLLWSRDADGGPQVRLVSDPTVSFFTDEVRCPIRVDRLAAAILELLDRPEITGPLHMAGADAVDRLALARALAIRAGREPGDLRGAPGDPDTARPRRLILDSSLARSLLGAPLPGIVDDRPSG